jgi:23S rRNA pseudouridine2605 synthase
MMAAYRPLTPATSTMPSPRRPKKTRSQSQRPSSGEAGERLQKVLAAAGLGSRRKCEELILQGRVEVDRQVVSELGARVNPLTQEVRVDGQALKKQRAVYFMVNKPPGVLSTNYDPEYRVRVVDLVKANERLFTVGRLDQHSEGLILVTNDGALANRLTHPRYGATKTYHVVVAGAIEPKTLERLSRGVHLAEGVARVASLKVKKQRPQSTELEMVLEEGKNREVRRVFAAVGHKVLKLRRVQIGPLKLAELPIGAHRPLTKAELEKLQEYAFAKRQPERKKKRPAKTGPRATATPESYDDEPLIDESDAALDYELDQDFDTGPVLVDEELTHFEKGFGRDDALAPRKPGAIIPYDADEPPPAAKPSRSQRPPGKFSKRARRAEQTGGARGKKPYGKRPAGQTGGKSAGKAGAKPPAPRAARKKAARRKGRP